MNSFPSSMAVTSPGEAPICPICHDHLYPAAKEFDNHQVAIARPCNHQFHTSCISRWLQDHFDCPLGKRVIERLEVKLTLNPGWQNRMVSAAGQGDIGLIRALLQRGADVDAGRSAGNTPLAMAVKNKHIHVALLLASKGTADAIGLNNLGFLCHHHGKDFPIYLHQAETWLLKASELGCAPAMNNLGSLYLRGGEGFPSDPQRAKTWFLKAAQLGDASAMSNLGSLYRTGRGFPADPHQAKIWLLKAAELGYAPAMSNLGSLYRTGKGFPADLHQAKIWLLKAAELGYAPAMNKLGHLYYVGGQNFPADLYQAETWLLKSAGMGHVPAMINLGYLYRWGGKDFPADMHRAEPWLLKTSDLDTWLHKTAEQGYTFWF